MAFDAANPFGQGGDPYEGMRNKAVQNAGNAQSQNMDAITRRYAAMGNLNSGSYAQAQTDANRNAQQDSQDQISNINLAEQQGSLPYAQMKQQQGQFEAGQGQQASQFAQSLAQSGELGNRQLDIQQNQQAMDQATNALNYSLAGYQQTHSGGLLGGGGFLGMGMGGNGQSGGFANFGM